MSANFLVTMLLNQCHPVLNDFLMKCKSSKTDGNNCNARPMSGSEYCYFHNPDVSPEERRDVQARGGKANAVVVKEPLPPVEVKDATDVVTLLQDTINQVRAGQLDVRIGNCIGVLSGHLIKALEVANIENRVEIIERAILERKTTIR